jgi:dehydrogenase/reductase SDR family member 7B
MKDSVVVITGGSSGIGKALAEVFGSHGCRILITGRNAADLEVAVAEIRAKGIDIHGFVADVSRETDNVNMAAEALRLFGRNHHARPL